MTLIGIYERDELMRDLLREWLSAAGYGVQDAITDVPAAADLLIVGLSLSKRDSEQLIGQLRRRHPGAPIIGLSSQARTGLCLSGAAARSLGVESLLAKPLGRNELLTAVAAALAAPSSHSAAAVLAVLD